MDVHKRVRDQAMVYMKREGGRSLLALMRSFGVSHLMFLSVGDALTLEQILQTANAYRCEAVRQDWLVTYQRKYHPEEPATQSPAESILQEAQRLTHGDRAAAYGDPFDDYTKTAGLVSALLAEKLKTPLTAHEMALVMCCVKLSREVRNPKRDNRVDLAGYAHVADKCVDRATPTP